MNSVAIRTASAFESVFRIAQPPITSLLSLKGPSVTVILPFASRTRTPSLLGRRPPVSTSVPSFSDFSTNLPIASISAAGGGDWRYDSGWRMNVRYFMAPPLGSDHPTNESGPDRHGPDFSLRRVSARWMRSLLRREHRREGPSVESGFDVKDPAVLDLVPFRDERRGGCGRLRLPIEQDGRVLPFSDDGFRPQPHP